MIGTHISKYYLSTLLIVLLFQNISISQYSIEGTVIDGINKNPISYVNVGIAEYAIGTVSDRSGYFKLEDERINSSTEITVSCIGYETKTISASSLNKNTSIVLSPVSYDIEPIQITSEALKKREIQYGIGNGIKRGKSIGFASQQLGTEVGALLFIKKASYIKSAHFEINHAKGDSMHFRVILRPYEKGEIGESILPADVYIHDVQTTGTIDVDLRSYDLKLRGHYLLSLQWIQNDGRDQNEGITFDTKRSWNHPGIFAKLFSTGDIEKFTYHGRLKPCFYLKGTVIERN